MKVKCPKCKRTNTYVTTEAYDPDKAPNGKMVALRNPKYKGGLTFGSVQGNTASVPAQLMECCDCGGMLTFGGKLIVIPDEKPKRKKAVKDEG